MNLLSPIGTLVKLSGSTGVLKSAPTATSTYDPAAVGDYVAPAPVETTIRGVLSKVGMAGEVVEHDAIFMISLTTMPVGFRAEQSECLVKGTLYTVMSAQQRWYLDACDGFTLQLKI